MSGFRFLLSAWLAISVVQAVEAAASETIPIAARMAITPLANERVEVVGAPGAAPPRADVLVVTLETGHYDFVEASAAGEFRAQLFAPAGTTLLVKADPSGTVVRNRLRESPIVDAFFNELIEVPGTILAVPQPPATGSEVAFGTAFMGSETGIVAPVIVRGSLSSATLAHDDTLTVSVAVRVLSMPSGPAPTVRAQLSLLPLTDSTGRAKLTENTFCSTVMTPTGLPIERTQWLYLSYRSEAGSALVQRDGGLEADLTLALRIERELPAAYYRPALLLTFQDVASSPLEGRVITFRDGPPLRSGSSRMLPSIRIGAAKPPRIPLVLLMNDVEQAMRGVTAIEDRNRFMVAPRLAVSSERLVVPRLDARTGSPRRYNLEPFAPTIALGDRGAPPAPPLIPVRFPSGHWRLTIRAPDGTTTVRGPLPFAQALLSGPGRDGGPMEGGPYITDAYQLLTSGDDASFDMEFPSDGIYRIEAEGSFDDVSGVRWSGGGTYEIEVARPLVIDSSTTIGTPFEAGDAITLSASLVPPIAAEIEFRVRFAPGSDTSRLIERTFRTRANRFGFANAGSFPFVEPGEYRLDVYATGDDGSGSRWAGVRTWGGVVAPRNSPLIAHGKRGIDDQQDNRQAWFVHTQVSGRGHVNLPFHSGDVMWMENVHAATPSASFEAPDDVLGVLNRYCCAGKLDEAARAGELPFFSANIARPLDIHLDESEPDIVAYAYRFVERPLVRVRETIAEEVINYWRFDDLYGRQLGNGANGDLPNDFKFQFVGAVVRGLEMGEPRYGIYGSLFVLVPPNDRFGGTRVLPPFQGNGGGPAGGPLFTLKGRDIDLFFHPTGVRAGTILEVGNIASFAGQIGPTLHGKVEIVVTAPSGARRTIAGQANKIGHFADPQSDFEVREAGLWKAKTQVWFDGVLPSTSGQVQPPYPAGDVLGSREGEFYFYVVDRESEPLQIASMPPFVRPADNPITFNVVPPAGLRDTQLTYTTTMPGFILEDGASSSLAYAYDAQKLARDFPNLDLRDVDGLSGVDTITVSFLLSGTDSAGARRHFARQIVIQGEELQMPEQTRTPKQPRRRAVRR